MTTVAAATPSRSGRRQRALDEYVDQLRRVVELHPGREAPLKLRIAERELTVEPWIVAELRDRNGSGLAAEDPRSLLAQAVAIQMKAAVDRDRLGREQQTRSQALYAVQAELMLDTAMTVALLREIQGAVDVEVRAGRMDRAKCWSRVKNTLHAQVGELKTLLADSERQRAESLADSFSDRPGQTDAEPERNEALMRQLAQEEALREAQKRVRRRGREALSNLPSRTELLVATLAVAAALWLGFVTLPQRFANPLPVLSAADFPPVVGIVAIDARPPSLYVTVDGSVWQALDDDARRHLVRTLSSVLMTSGYRGALLRTAEGRPVAQWLALNGVELLEARERGLPAGIEPPPTDRSRED